MTTAPARLTAEEVTLHYGSFVALQAVSFTVPAGQYVVLLGENGAGKSSLLRCLAGWTRPTRGTVRIDGRPLEEDERAVRSRLKFVPDTPAFYPDLTAREHVDLVARAHRLAPTYRETADGLLRAFGLGAQSRAYPAAFSRGMQYKLALVLALVTDPALLLLDEPFAPLDPAAQLHLAAHLRRLAAAGTTVVASTHLLPPEVPPDRLLVLEGGRLVRDLPVAEASAGRGDPAHLPRHVLLEVLRRRTADPDA
ncbi:MAG: ABC transporter ATP-binding protein [Actinomycetia bacterium]|nr:ABC transporter ATP-binding protein [Actinomycetes bacterium]